jgi:transmembrane sensor
MKTNYSMENPGWEILSRYLTGETDPAESKQIEVWAGKSEENLRELERCRKLLEATDKVYGLKKFNTDVAWQNVQLKSVLAEDKKFLSHPARMDFLISFAKYAAILIITLLIGSAGYYLFSTQAKENFSIVVSGENTINEVTLPDGTFVTLNNNSIIEYPNKFRDNIREVTITGEAFFDVNPDPDKPFIINAGIMQVKVLGTSFNVRAYPEAESVEVTVETGVVEILFRNNEKQDEKMGLLLYEGEKGTWHNMPGFLEKSFNSNPNYNSWKTQNLIFNKTYLKDVIQQMEEIYHIDVRLADPELEKLVLTAHFEKKSPDFILNVLKLTFGLNLTREHETYILSVNKEK